MTKVRTFDQALVNKLADSLPVKCTDLFGGGVVCLVVFCFSSACKLGFNSRSLFSGLESEKLCSYSSLVVWQPVIKPPLLF